MRLYKRYYFVLLALLASPQASEFSWSLPPADGQTLGLAGMALSSQQMVICSDEAYHQRLVSLSPLAPEIIRLEKPLYIKVGGNDYHLLAHLVSEGCIRVSQGTAQIKHKPQDNDYFVTHSLMDCVAIAIHTSKAAYFSHMDLENIVSGKLERLLDRVPSEIRAKAKVTLVSSHYSVVLTNIYQALKSRGFKTIHADIEECILTWTSSLKEARKYLKASSLGVNLKSIASLTLDQLFEKCDQTKVTAPRSLIMHAKTGTFYTLMDWPQRHKETSILYALEKRINSQAP